MGCLAIRARDLPNSHGTKERESYLQGCRRLLGIPPIRADCHPKDGSFKSIKDGELLTI